MFEWSRLLRELEWMAVLDELLSLHKEPLFEIGFPGNTSFARTQREQETPTTRGPDLEIWLCL